MSIKQIKNNPFEEETVRQISYVNPISDFNKMMTNKKEDQVEEAIEQM